MSTVSNFLTAVILAPMVTVMSAISIATLQRSLEWIASISNNPQKGFLKDVRPYAKNVNVFLERIMGGSKFTVNSTTILLMAIVLLLLCLLMEGGQKTRMVKVVEKSKDE